MLCIPVLEKEKFGYVRKTHIHFLAIVKSISLAKKVRVLNNSFFFQSLNRSPIILFLQFFFWIGINDN